MYEKYLGTILILAGCTGISFSAAASYLRTEKTLEGLIRILEYMERDLLTRLTPLPELCRQAGKSIGGKVGRVFLDFARELDWMAAPDALGCMKEAVRKNADLPHLVKKQLDDLGSSLGKYDLEMQTQTLRSVRTNCEAQFRELKNGKQLRLRNCRTFGLCSGAALVILLV